MNVLAAGIFFLSLENRLNEQDTGSVDCLGDRRARAVMGQSMVMVNMGRQMVGNPEQSRHVRHDHQAQDGPGQGRVGSAGGLGHDTDLS